MKDPYPNSADALRRQAEELTQRAPPALPDNAGALSPAEIQGVLHDLRVHQIELEMQNEELRCIQTELEISQARYFDLYDLAPVGYFALDGHGMILEANLTAAQLLGVALG